MVWNMDKLTLENILENVNSRGKVWRVTGGAITGLNIANYLLDIITNNPENPMNYIAGAIVGVSAYLIGNGERSHGYEKADYLLKSGLIKLNREEE